jgi:hypothetical protein
MDDFYRLFHINSRHRILVCTDCQYAVVPTQIGKNLQAHHIHLSLQQRRATVSGVEELVELAGMPSDVVYPSPSDLPVTHLPVHFDDLKWNGYDAQGAICSYICRIRCGMREHCGQSTGGLIPKSVVAILGRNELTRATRSGPRTVHVNGSSRLQRSSNVLK